MDLINDCFTSGVGDEILAALGDRTHSTQNTQIFVPTVTYNDIFLQDLQDNSLTNFSSVFCSQVAVDQLVDFCGVRNNSTESGASSLILSGTTVFVYTLFLINKL